MSPVRKWARHKKNFSNKSLRKLSQLLPLIIISQKENNADSVGEMTQHMKILVLYHANALVVLDSFITYAWKIGYHKSSRREIQMIWLVCIGKLLNVKSVNQLTLISLRSRTWFTNLWTFKNLSQDTLLSWSLFLWKRTHQEQSMFSTFLKRSHSLTWEEVMKVRSELMIFLFQDVTPYLNTNQMVFILRIIDPNLEL